MATVRAPGPSPPTSARTETCPYLGLVPFSGDDARYFFGREGDCEIIAANLIASRLTILYAPSGVGKTSVLRAGVAHGCERLHDEGRPEFLVAVVRRWAVDPIGEIDLAVEDAGRRAGLTAPDRQPRLVDRLRAWSDASGATLLLVFDQFEEFLLYHHDTWQPGEPAHEVAAALGARDLEANFLLSMREDALAKLDRFKGRVPHLFENYLRLDRLDGEGGRAAIEGPIAAWNDAHEDDPMAVDPGLVDALLDELSSVRVAQGRGGAAEVTTGRRADIEAPYLQLMMTRLWELERARGSPRLTAETLAAVGTVSEIVRAHVDGHMGRISRRQRDVAAAVFHQLVTPSGAKVARSLDDLEAYTNLPRERIRALLTTLSQSDWLIVRAVAADESGVAVYEIYHDVLAEAVLDWRARHEERRRIRKIARIAIAVAVVLAGIAIAALVLAAYVDEKADKATAAEGQARVAEGRATLAKQEALARVEVGQDADKAIRHALAATTGNQPPETAQAALRLVLARDAVASWMGDPTMSTGEVRDFEVSPSGLHVVIVSKEGRTRVWDLRTAKVSAELEGDWQNVAFDRTGERVAVAGKQAKGGEDAVEVWSVDGKQRQALDAPRGAVSVAWSSNGRWLAVGGQGRAVVWKSLTGRPRAFDTADGVVDRIAWSPGGHRIATVAGRHVQIWDTEHDRLATMPGGGGVKSVAFSPDGSELRVARVTGAVDVLSRNGNHYRCKDAREMQVTTATFTADGRYLVSGQNVPDRAHAPEVRRLEITRKCPSRLLALPEGVRITSVVAGNGARVIYSAGSDRTVRVWDVERNIQLATLPGLGDHTQLVARRAAEGGSDVLLSASVDGRLKLWRPGVVPLARFDAGASVRAVAFDETGKDIFATTVKGVRSSGSTKPLQSRELGRRSVFSQDGTLLAATSKTGVRVLTTDGDERVSLKEPGVTSLDFSADGSRLLTMNQDGIARIWRTDRRADRRPRSLKVPSGRGSPYAFFNSDGTRAIVVFGEVREYDAVSRILVDRRESTGGAPKDTGFGAPPAAAGAGHLAGALGRALPWVGTGIRSKDELAGTGAVTAMTFSPDANVVATAGQDGLRLWDAVRGDPFVTLATGQFDAVDFSEDGTRLVAAAGRTVFVFSCRPCGSLRTVRGVALRRSKGTEQVVLRAFSQPTSGLRDYRFRRPAAEPQMRDAEPTAGPVETITPQTPPGPSATPAPTQAREQRSGGGSEQDPVPVATAQPEPAPAPTPEPTPTATEVATPESGSEAVPGDRNRDGGG